MGINGYRKLEIANKNLPIRIEHDPNKASKEAFFMSVSLARVAIDLGVLIKRIESCVFWFRI